MRGTNLRRLLIITSIGDNKSSYNYQSRILMKKILIIILLFTGAKIHAQEDQTISLVVSGDGKNKSEATEAALRNAVEQAFGAFISSETVINNDEFVSDNINMLSQGSVLKYDILTAYQLPDGSYSITAKALVSISAIQKFTESKGHITTIEGGLFGLNIRLAKLQADSEEKVIIDIIKKGWQILKTSTDYSLEIVPPRKSNIQIDLQNLLHEGGYMDYYPQAENLNSTDIYRIRCIVECKPNSNLDIFIDYFLGTLNSIKMSPSEVEFAKTSGTQIYGIWNSTGRENEWADLADSERMYYLRSVKSLWYINYLFEVATLGLLNYDIVSNDSILSYNPLSKFRHIKDNSELYRAVAILSEDEQLSIIDKDHFILTLGFHRRQLGAGRDLAFKYPTDFEEINGLHYFNLYKRDHLIPINRYGHGIYHFNGWAWDSFKETRTSMNERYHVVDFYLPVADVERIKNVEVKGR